MAIKRVFDIVASSLMLVIFGPIMLSVAFLIRRKLGKPVLFRQIRPGLGNWTQIIGQDAISWQKKVECGYE